MFSLIAGQWTHFHPFPRFLFHNSWYCHPRSWLWQPWPQMTVVNTDLLNIVLPNIATLLDWTSLLRSKMSKIKDLRQRNTKNNHQKTGFSGHGRCPGLVQVSPWTKSIPVDGWWPPSPLELTRSNIAVYTYIRQRCVNGDPGGRHRWETWCKKGGEERGKRRGKTSASIHNSRRYSSAESEPMALKSNAKVPYRLSG